MEVLNKTYRDQDELDCCCNCIHFEEMFGEDALRKGYVCMNEDMEADTKYGYFYIFPSSICDNFDPGDP